MVLDKKGKGHETKHAREAEADFKVLARRNRLLGDWLAQKFGLTDDDAAQYAKEVVIADLDEPGDEDVIRKVMADIASRNLNISENEIRDKLGELVAVARTQLEAEG